MKLNKVFKISFYSSYFKIFKTITHSSMLFHFILVYNFHKSRHSVMHQNGTYPCKYELHAKANSITLECTFIPFIYTSVYFIYLFLFCTNIHIIIIISLNFYRTLGSLWFLFLIFCISYFYNFVNKIVKTIKFCFLFSFSVFTFIFLQNSENRKYRK